MNLDELQVNVEKLLALLKDRQVGLMMWNQMLNDRLQEIKRQIEQAGVN